MGGWVAESLAITHPERMRGRSSWEVATPPRPGRSPSRPSSATSPGSTCDLPPLFFATETLRYLPNHELQDDSVVETWLSMIGEMPVWPNPGRLGQYEACLAWSSDTERIASWAIDLGALPGVGIRARCRLAPGTGTRGISAPSREPASCEIAGASHLGVFTHGDGGGCGAGGLLRRTLRPSLPVKSRGSCAANRSRVFRRKPHPCGPEWPGPPSSPRTWPRRPGAPASWGRYRSHTAPGRRPRSPREARTSPGPGWHRRMTLWRIRSATASPSQLCS